MGKKVVLGFSCGDINGVGIETLLKALSNKRIFEFCTPVLYAPVELFLFYKKTLNQPSFNYQLISSSKDVFLHQFNIIQFVVDDIEFKPGKSSRLSAEIALKSLDLAISDLLESKIDALVTLPVNKKNISIIEKDFFGHTEYLLKKTSVKENLMLLCHDNLRVATATNHIPVSKIANSISSNLIFSKIQVLLESLMKDFGILKPKVAVLSLNPHGGDDGLIGDEELKIINPVISEYTKRGNLVYGSYSADAFFGTGNYKNFDAVFAMYHDQALVPFKSMSFGNGVNYTAGLPVIRVSPDHGVAYDIAGKGRASPSSLLSAISLAIQIYNNKIYDLQYSNFKKELLK